MDHRITKCCHVILEDYFPNNYEAHALKNHTYACNCDVNYQRGAVAIKDLDTKYFVKTETEKFHGNPTTDGLYHLKNSDLDEATKQIFDQIMSSYKKHISEYVLQLHTFKTTLEKVEELCELAHLETQNWYEYCKRIQKKLGCDDFIRTKTVKIQCIIKP